jgi:ribosomal protein S18 acetylase RimI-like enzyme
VPLAAENDVARIDRFGDMGEASVRDLAVRRATAADVSAIGQLLHDFNGEYDDPTPGPVVLAERIGRLLGSDETVILLGGSGPDGLAVLRFRPSFWSAGLECYLAELYVAPARRGQGLGRQLMERALDQARQLGADYMDLGTSEADVAARALYESLGFTNREGGLNGPVNFCYERDL